jgi:nucleoside-diphosphate-sugar epimerase
MYVDDAVAALMKIAADTGFSGTVDLSCGSPVTIDAIVETMARVAGVDIRVIHEGHTEEYIEFQSVDRTMRERFGFAPSVPFEAGIARLRDFLASTSRERYGQTA